jgi:predicted secreted protein
MSVPTAAGKLTLGALAAVLLLVAGLQAAAPALVITDQDNGRAYTVRVGEEFTVNLRHPGSGGYSFLTPENDREILKMVREHRLPPAEPRRLGDFGRMVFEFKALQAGATALVIPIKRPWEKDSLTYLRVTITVR